MRATCLIFLILGSYSAAMAQEGPRISSFCADSTVHQGELHRSPVQNLQCIVVLKNGDTVSGCMQLNDNRVAVPKANDREYRFIEPKDIKKVEVGIYSLYRKPVELYSMDYKPMRGVFWRLIESKGKFTVFDRSEGVFSDLPAKEVRGNNTSKNGFNEYMYLVSTDNHVEEIYGRFSILSGMFLVKNKAKNRLLRYINRKYKKQFKESDFKTEMEMVDYILTQENAAQT